MNKINPWIGWSSYDEASIAKGNSFVGRSTETSELFSLIDNNLLVTLYGKSGIGKSSLLNAGVFPSLKAADYEPIICRCGENDYFTTILSQIRTQCSSSSIRNISEFSTLIELFKYSEFSKKGKSVFPVLVFDQFEDWFKVNSNVETLLKELNYLISNEYEGVTNYRFVISIREDYLYLLEDAIDKQNLLDLKSNRYRLTELKKHQAEEIFDLGEIDSVIQGRLLEISQEGNGYNPGLISFFCSQLYELYPNGITMSALQSIADENTLIERYYNRCFEHNNLSNKTKSYIESNLQDEGLRRPQNIKSVKKHIPTDELTKLILGKNKLLRVFPVGDDEHIELIHDRIAEIIYNHRNNQMAVQRDKSIALSIIFYFVAVGFCIWNMIINIMHASWGLMRDNYTSYLNEILSVGDTQIDYLFEPSLSKLLIYSQTIGLVVLIYLLVLEIPKQICNFFYASLKLRNGILVLLAIVIAYFLSSPAFIEISLKTNSYIYAALGWLVIYGELIIANVLKKQKHNEN